MTGRKKFLLFLSYLCMILLFGWVFHTVYSSIFDTPDEKRMKRENNQLMIQYDLLNNRVDKLETVLKDMENRDDNIYRSIFNAEPIPKSIRSAGFGGVNRYEVLEGYDNSEIVINTTKRLDKLTKEVYVQSKSYDEIIELAKNREDQLACLPSIMPISNRDLTRTASGWGYRIHPIYKIRKFHYGMDFTAPTGTEVYATADGVVEIVDRSRRGYGNKIVLDHGFGYETLYGHLSAFNVRRGRKVRRGDVIGFVGSTGQSTGPHLHYEVHLNGKQVNPINYYFNDLSPDEWDRMIQLSINTGSLD